MELRHLRYFIAAAEELNISKASRRLNVSQPAVSRLIQDLEDELGISLFVRERFGISLTTAGERLLVYARQIFDVCDEATRVIKNLPESGVVLNIGFIPSTLGSFLGESLCRFREQNCGITIKIHELSPADQILALQKKQIDLALLGSPYGVVADEFEIKILSLLEVHAVIPGRHSLANNSSVKLRDLAQYDFIGYSEQSFPGRNQLIINTCGIANFKPAIRYHADSLVEVLAMIGSGAGICVMPANVASLPHPNVVFIPIEEKLPPARCAVAWRHNDERVPLQQLLECLSQTSAAGQALLGSPEEQFSYLNKADNVTQ